MNRSKGGEGERRTSPKGIEGCVGKESIVVIDGEREVGVENDTVWGGGWKVAQVEEAQGGRIGLHRAACRRGDRVPIL